MIEGRGNAYETFGVAAFRLPAHERRERGGGCSVRIEAQTLNMMSGVLRTDARIDRTIKTSSDVFACRHVPGVLVQSLRLTPYEPMRILRLEHEVTNVARFSRCSFHNMTVHVHRSAKVHMLVSEGRHETLGDVACVTAYVFDGCIHEGMGMNTYKHRDGVEFAQNKFDLFLLEPYVAARIHAVHVVARVNSNGGGCATAATAVDEARKVVLTILGRESTPIKSVQRLREDHVKAWSDVWKTNVSLTPKCSASDEDKQLAEAYKKHIRYSMYCIYAMSRCHATPVRGGAEDDFPVIDVDGRFLRHCDVFFVPLMAILKPDLASAIVDYRYRTLDRARLAAESYGFEGAMIAAAPSTASDSSDSCGSSSGSDSDSCDSLSDSDDGHVDFWNSKHFRRRHHRRVRRHHHASAHRHNRSRMHDGGGAMWTPARSPTVYDGALVVVSAWSCYRLLRNRDWLRNKGYAMMVEVATFLMSFVRSRNPATDNDHGCCRGGGDDSDDDACARNEYYTPATTGVGGQESDENNAFTNRAICLALKAVIEASWELGLAPEPRWLRVFHGLGVPRSRDKVVRFDEANLRCDDRRTFKVLEPLLLTVPTYVSETDPVDDGRMLAHWSEADERRLEKRKGGDRRDLATNAALRAICASRRAQKCVVAIEDAQRSAEEFLREVSCGTWGGFCERRQVRPDPNFCATFLVAMLQGWTNIRVCGGVADTRFYYEEMRLQAAITANLPSYWDKIVVNGVGAKQSQNFKTLNSMLKR